MDAELFRGLVFSLRWSVSSSVHRPPAGNFGLNDYNAGFESEELARGRGPRGCRCFVRLRRAIVRALEKYAARLSIPKSSE